jgi:hypothetical protein
MLRRNFLIATTAIVPITGCSTIAQTFDSKLSLLVSDVTLIANGVSSLLPTIGSIAGLSDTVKSTIQLAIDGIREVANQIKGVTSTAAGQPWIQKLETYLNAIVSALSMLPLPPQVSVILQAATVLLPILETIVGLLTNLTPATARVQSGAMSPDAARAALALAAAKK